ncbi:helix-turn-helix transcriptional regulator [Micromonospora sp. NPDC050686]|uniref:helix-turn-helix domain-containing protein n=1 Tax=Micromonospora sp. NPDC050686 TaxID=3154631 RepID=UPI0033E683C5
MAQQPSAEDLFGTQVRQAREARGWTQDRLRRVLRDVAGLDLSSTAMTRLEQGKRPIRLNEVTALARVLELELAQYGGTEVRLTQHDAYEQAKTQLAELQGMLEAAENELAAASITEQHARQARVVAMQHVDVLRRQYTLLQTAISQYDMGREELLRELHGPDRRNDGQH